MTLPATLKVAAHTYKVRRRSSTQMGDAAGLCHYGRFLDVLRGQPRMDEADTLIHEAFHAVLHGQGRDFGGDPEELYVRALATGLVQLIRDNPDFGRWLASLSHDHA